MLTIAPTSQDVNLLPASPRAAPWLKFSGLPRISLLPIQTPIQFAFNSLAFNSLCWLPFSWNLPFLPQVTLHHPTFSLPFGSEHTAEWTHWVSGPSVLVRAWSPLGKCINWATRISSLRPVFRMNPSGSARSESREGQDTAKKGDGSQRKVNGAKCSRGPGSPRARTESSDSVARKSLAAF